MCGRGVVGVSIFHVRVSEYEAPFSVQTSRQRPHSPPGATQEPGHCASETRANCDNVSKGKRAEKSGGQGLHIVLLWTVMIKGYRF